MSADNELFELCKEVYERTGWDSTEKCYAYLKNPYFDVWEWEVIPLHEDNVDDVDEWHPLYSSDYLLEKLPKKIRHHGKRLAPRLQWVDESKWWLAHYYEEKGGVPEYNEVADTPLKSLLKLTIALHEAGELK